MINVKKGIDILRAYELEGYRRLYAASIDKNGNCGNFDEILFVNNNQSDNDKIIINFDDYYCPHITQKNIISKLLNILCIEGLSATTTSNSNGCCFPYQKQGFILSAISNIPA